MYAGRRTAATAPHTGECRRERHLRTSRAAIIPQVDDPAVTYHLTTDAKTRPQVVAADASRSYRQSAGQIDRHATKELTMIEAHGLTKRYGDTLAVDDLSFQIRPGRVTGFLGPNRAGKSTTMRMILGLDDPTSGSVTIDGQRYAEHERPLRQIGALLDAKAVHPGRSAYHHLLALAQTNGIPPRRVPEVLELVGLEQVARQRAGKFSSAWANGSGSPPRCSATPRCCSSTNR